jgi:hypothetical protein
LNSRTNISCVLLAALTTVLLVGCATPEERARQARIEAQAARAAAEQRRAALEGQCRGYGFEPRSQGMANCLMQLDQAQRRAVQARRQQEELESRCELARANALLSPGRTGSFGEAAQRSTEAYSACVDGRSPPRGPINVVCRRSGLNDIYCQEQ